MKKKKEIRVVTSFSVRASTLRRMDRATAKESMSRGFNSRSAFADVAINSLCEKWGIK